MEILFEPLNHRKTKPDKGVRNRTEDKDDLDKRQGNGNDKATSKAKNVLKDKGKAVTPESSGA